MKTQIEKIDWGINSVSLWLTGALALGIIFIGARFIYQPQVGAVGYGIALSDTHTLAYGKINGIRDIFSGLALLPLLIMRMRKATAWVLTCAIIVPATDFLIVLYNNGSKDVEHLMIHSLTAAVIVIDSILLFQKVN